MCARNALNLVLKVQIQCRAHREAAAVHQRLPQLLHKLREREQHIVRCNQAGAALGGVHLGKHILRRSLLSFGGRNIPLLHHRL